MNICYHNPKCSKSRAGLEIIQEKNYPCEVKEYINEGLSSDEVQIITQFLKISAQDIIRKKEELYKEQDIDESSMSEQEWIQLLVDHPKLLERPIVVNGNKAVIGRPPENVLTLL